MKHTYQITGMTCEGCKKTIVEKLNNLEEITSVEVDLATHTATLTMNTHISLEVLQKALPAKYIISEIKQQNIVNTPKPLEEPKTKLQQLKPLFLIFGYLFASAILLHYKDWNTSEAMLDFMGLFYIVFSFFKFLDLKGFPESFAMYDPLAKFLPFYGWIYPFIELALGLLFLFRIEVTLALVVTVIILGITTMGVTKTLMDKKSIQCACLGTVLRLPMTEATFIENTIMIVMAVITLINLM